MLKVVYSFFLGLLLVVFVGMGVASFYPAPKAPEYPKVLETSKVGIDEYTDEQRQADKDYMAATEAYSDRSNDYNRNVAMIVLAAAVILLVVGLAMESRATVLADGLLLGGVFTLLYSIGRSFAGDDPKYSFAVTAVGLAVTIVVGYRKFISSNEVSKKKPKKKN